MDSKTDLKGIELNYAKKWRQAFLMVLFQLWKLLVLCIYSWFFINDQSTLSILFGRQKKNKLALKKNRDILIEKGEKSYGICLFFLPFSPMWARQNILHLILFPSTAKKNPR